MARSDHTATLLPDGGIVVVGGDALGTVELFDPKDGFFRILEARLAAPHFLHAAAPLKGGELLIASGLSARA